MLVYRTFNGVFGYLLRVRHFDWSYVTFDRCD